MLLRIAAGVAIVMLAGAGQSGREFTRNEGRALIMGAQDERLLDLPAISSPALDHLRARRDEQVRSLVELARGPNAGVRREALLALGRYERRELTTEILQYFANAPAEMLDAVIHAAAQSMQGPPLPADRGGEQVDGVLELLLTRAQPFDAGSAPGAMPRALARLPYTTNAQVAAVDAYLRRALTDLEPAPTASDQIFEFARGAELLARRHAKLGGIGEETLSVLRRIVAGRRRTHAPHAREAAMSALLAGAGVDADTLRIAAGATFASEVRRLAAVTLGGGASSVAPTERTDMLIALLRDPSAMVRYEAVRAWARQETAANGCQRLQDALSDENTHVALAAIDALGDRCKADVSVTDRLMTEARTPPTGQNWHRESHALMALAKRAPDRVRVPLAVHAPHAVWQVRMYAARVAALVEDLTWLETLALDDHPNVRDAALAALARLKGADAEPYLVSALKMDDYQLLRTVAIILKGARSTRLIADGLKDALLRLTRQRHEVSREARLALLERLTELGDANYAGALEPLLRDFDIPVAIAAAGTIQQWTGKLPEVAPQPAARPPLPQDVEIQELLPGDKERWVRVRLGSGRSFRIRMLAAEMPLTSVRFVRLVKAGHYDGLSFHRVAPNFVVQGGSPGANEYSAQGPMMRDEISTEHHRRGTVGLSTRGRDTGDMQFFVNLVDNPRLDFDYTVFGVVHAQDLPVVDSILEGERIADMSLVETQERRARPRR